MGMLDNVGQAPQIDLAQIMGGGGMPPLMAQPAQQQPQAAPQAPQQAVYPGLKKAPPPVGTTVNGYTYMGGDPRSKDPTVWKPASGDDFLNSLQVPDDKKALIKMVANYEAPGSGARGIGSPEVQQILGLAKQYDPTFDVKNYAGVQKARTEIGNPDSKFNLTKTALNTALDHAKLLADNIDALHNTGSPAYNAVGNWIDRNVLGDPRQGNFEQVARTLGGEVVKANTGTQGGGEGDRQEQAGSYPVNGSPQQQYGSLQQTVKLLNGKLSEMQATIKQAKLANPNTSNLLSPSAQASYDYLNKRFSHQGNSSTPQAANAPKGIDPTLWSHMTPQEKALWPTN